MYQRENPETPRLTATTVYLSLLTSKKSHFQENCNNFYKLVFPANRSGFQKTEVLSLLSTFFFFCEATWKHFI